MNKFDLNDILIVPRSISSINSRNKITPIYNINSIKNVLPIMTAPMDTVISEDNIGLFNENKINICLPRGVEGSGKNVMTFKSYGLQEFQTLFLNDKSRYVKVPYKYLLIDIANGHMKSLLQIVKDFKEVYGDEYKLMVGNVANPETYEELARAGADFIRVGIGNGNGCLTTQQTGVGYPMGSLIRECYEKKNEITRSLIKSRNPVSNPAMIVADGGMKDFSDIIKSLALGADFVMVGSILNKALESAGRTTCLGIPVDQLSTFTEWLYKRKFPIKKKFRGMSTKEVQKSWGKNTIKTSEGIVTTRKVEYTLEGWVDNFEHYLRTSMSYTGAESLNEYTGLCKTEIITYNALKRFSK